MKSYGKKLYDFLMDIITWSYFSGPPNHSTLYISTNFSHKKYCFCFNNFKLLLFLSEFIEIINRMSIFTFPIYLKKIFYFYFIYTAFKLVIDYFTYFILFVYNNYFNYKI